MSWCDVLISMPVNTWSLEIRFNKRSTAVLAMVALSGEIVVSVGLE
jgi:hypothetical protein